MDKNWLRVVSARSEDVPGLLEILRQSPEAGDWSENHLLQALTCDASHFFVARQCEEMIGFVSGRCMRDEAEILNLAVKPNFRRQGTGKALIRHLLEIFAHEQVARVFLEVRKSNATAITFYEGLGFRQVGLRPAYYSSPSESALILALSLSNV
jgi:[ribosomal protein S18]-alanine N-acetyltransferase